MNNFVDIPFDKIVESHDISLFYNKIFKIHWVMSYFCNYDCPYCWPSSKHKIKETRHVYEFLDATARLMDEIQLRGYKNYQLTLSGGEPTVHPHILPVLSEFIKHKNDDSLFNLTIVSNLSRTIKWFDKFIETVQDFNNVMIVASYHSKFADVDEFAMKVKYLMEHGINVHINVTFSVDAFEEYHLAALYFKEQGLIVKALPHRSTNSRDYTSEELKILQESFCLDSAKNIPSLNKMPTDFVSNKSVSGNGYNIELVDDAGKKYFIDYPERLPSLGFTEFKDWICYSGFQSICIDEDGSTKRGRAGCWNEYIGNIFDSTTKILHDSPKPCTRNYCSAATDSVTHKIKPINIVSKNRLRLGEK